MSILVDTDRRGWLPAGAALGVIAGVLSGVVVVLVGPLPILAAIVGLVALALTVRAPGVVLAAYLLIPYYKGAFQGYSPIDLTVLLAAMNAAQVLALARDGWRRDIAVVGVVLWLWLGLLVLAGVLYAPDQSLALGHAVAYWALVILPILPAALRVGAEPRSVDQFLWSFFVMGLVTAALGVLQLSTSARLVVLGMNTIQVARAALLVPLIGVLYSLPQRRVVAALVTVVMVPAALVVAIASGSRGPLLVAAILAFVALIRSLGLPSASRGRVLTAGAGLGLVAIVGISVAGPSLPALSLARFASLFEFVQGGGPGYVIPGGDTSAAARVQLFQFAGELWSQHPLIGAGTGGFETISMRMLGPAGDAYPHNALLQVAAEYGLLGLSLFVVLIAAALVRPLPGRLTGTTIRALFAFFLLNAMVSGDIFSDRETLGLLLLILVIAVPRIVAGPARARADRAPESRTPDVAVAASPTAGSWI